MVDKNGQLKEKDGPEAGATPLQESEEDVDPEVPQKQKKQGNDEASEEDSGDGDGNGEEPAPKKPSTKEPSTTLPPASVAQPLNVDGNKDGLQPQLVKSESKLMDPVIPITKLVRGYKDEEEEEERRSLIAAKKKRREKMEERASFKTGELVESKTFTWKINSVIRSGKYSDGYKVTKVNNPDNKEYAMKTELAAADKFKFGLKIEVIILSECRKIRCTERKRHFRELFDWGRNSKLKFAVVSLVGLSLNDIRRRMYCKHYSTHTAMLAAKQTFQSVWDLHAIGWIHRDIRPNNFAIGIGSLETTLFMQCCARGKRIFEKGTTQVRVPRAGDYFLGSRGFASRATHERKEQGRKDDIESWLYMVFDLFDEDHGLPWKRVTDRRLFPKYKNQLFKHQFPRTYTIVPKDFRNILNYVDGLSYADEPNYQYIKNAMEEIAKTNNIAVDNEPDWIKYRDEIAYNGALGKY